METNNLNTLSDLLNGMKKKIKIELSSAVKESSEAAVGIIKRRTARGLDVNGASFSPYKSMTIRLKGRSNVDLKDSGSMLSSLRSRRVSKFKYKVSVSSSQNTKAAKLQNGTKKMVARKFIGISSGIRKNTMIVAKKHIKRLIK